MFAETAPEASNRAHDMKPNHGFDRLSLGEMIPETEGAVGLLTQVIGSEPLVQQRARRGRCADVISRSPGSDPVTYVCHQRRQKLLMGC